MTDKTAEAAEELQWEWGGADISDLAYELVEIRLVENIDLTSSLASRRACITFRTDLGKLSHYRTHKKDLFGEQEGFCAECGWPFHYADREVDHIAALGKGGADHRDNLQLLRRRRNGRKGKGEMSELVAALMDDRIGQYR